jgi:hypothetical protein
MVVSIVIGAIRVVNSVVAVGFVVLLYCSGNPMIEVVTSETVPFDLTQAVEF